MAISGEGVPSRKEGAAEGKKVKIDREHQSYRDDLELLAELGDRLQMTKEFSFPEKPKHLKDFPPEVARAILMDKKPIGDFMVYAKGTYIYTAGKDSYLQVPEGLTSEAFQLPPENRELPSPYIKSEHYGSPLSGVRSLLRAERNGPHKSDGHCECATCQRAYGIALAGSMGHGDDV